MKTNQQSHQNKTSALVQIADQIPAPDVYLGRLCPKGLTLPDNVFLVCRRTAAHLLVTPQHHDFNHRWLLAIPLLGSGTMIVDGEEFPLQPSQSLLVPPCHLHRYTHISKGRILWLFISFNAPVEESSKPERGLITKESQQILQNVINLWLNEAVDRTARANLVMQVALLLISIRENGALGGKGATVTRNAELLERINQWVETHFSNSGNLNDLAHGIGYSESHLRSVFRSHFGLSLGRYVREKRCRTAAIHLRENDLSVSEVSDTFGFTSVYAFSRTFKKVIGLPPSAFRSH